MHHSCSPREPRCARARDATTSRSRPRSVPARRDSPRHMTASTATASSRANATMSNDERHLRRLLHRRRPHLPVIGSPGPRLATARRRDAALTSRIPGTSAPQHTPRRGETRPATRNARLCPCTERTATSQRTLSGCCEALRTSQRPFPDAASALRTSQRTLSRCSEPAASFAAHALPLQRARCGDRSAPSPLQRARCELAARSLSENLGYCDFAVHPFPRRGAWRAPRAPPGHPDPDRCDTAGTRSASARFSTRSRCRR